LTVLIADLASSREEGAAYEAHPDGRLVGLRCFTIRKAKGEEEK